MASDIAPEDRVIQLGTGLAALPKRLLLAHARGEVLFICGAGVSKPAGLPDFRHLVLDVYGELDASAHAVLANLPQGASNQWQPVNGELTDRQTAEVRRFISGDYDVVLGMLERRLDDQTHGGSRVRRTVAAILRSGAVNPAAIHKALMILSDRGAARTIVTTNFDLLLEVAARRSRASVQTYSLGAIPRPSRQPDFSGVLHIHGALDRSADRTSELVLSDQDFGEVYLRRRVVPDFIYDAARLYHLVLVGYSANDAPMRYLLNAVAADGKRFDDLKERFTFTSTSDLVELEDWRGRGITPIQYDAEDNHRALRATLERWAALSPINGKKALVDTALRRIVRKDRRSAKDVDRDLFDHFFRRDTASERARMSSLVSEVGAGLEWLDVILKISAEPERRRQF